MWFVICTVFTVGGGGGGSWATNRLLWNLGLSCTFKTMDPSWAICGSQTLTIRFFYTYPPKDCTALVRTKGIQELTLQKPLVNSSPYGETIQKKWKKLKRQGKDWRPWAKEVLKAMWEVASREFKGNERGIFLIRYRLPPATWQSNQVALGEMNGRPCRSINLTASFAPGGRFSLLSQRRGSKYLPTRGLRWLFSRACREVGMKTKSSTKIKDNSLQLVIIQVFFSLAFRCALQVI